MVPHPPLPSPAEPLSPTPGTAPLRSILAPVATMRHCPAGNKDAQVTNTGGAGLGGQKTPQTSHAPLTCLDTYYRGKAT